MGEIIKKEVYPRALEIFPGVEVAKVGEVPFVSVGFGEHRTTREQMIRWIRGKSLDEIKPMIGPIKGYGFEAGWHHPSDWNPYSKEAFDQNIDRVTALFEGLASLRHWNKIDQLFFSSVSVSPDVLPIVIERLTAKGIKINKSAFYGLACDGGIAMMLDAGRREDLQGARVVTGALENLSGLPIDPLNPKLATLFGNGAGGTAFISGQEFEVLPETVSAVVKLDTEGVIKLPQAYDVENYRSQSITLLPWYKIESGSESAFVRTENATIMKMPTNGIKAQVSPGSTAKFFSRLAKPLIVQTLTDSQPVENAFLHPASLAVFSLIYKAVKDEMTKKGMADKIPNFPWLMDKTGKNNCSSATIYAALVEAVRQGLIKPDVPNLYCGFGVGAVAHKGVGIFHQKST